MSNFGVSEAHFRAQRKAEWIAAVVVGAMIVLACGVLWSVRARPAAALIPSPKVAQANHVRAGANFASLPLAFEPNVGQTDPTVEYSARGREYSLFLTHNAAYFTLPIESTSARDAGPVSPTATGLSRHSHLNRPRRDAATIQMNMVGSNPHPQITAENRLPGVTNYILGRDSSNWRNNVAHYGQVRYHDIYAGVDLAFHGASHSATDVRDKFEFDFLVSPGTNPQTVNLEFSGAKSLRITPAGDLVLGSAAHDLNLHRPFAYQEMNGVRKPVDARFVLQAGNRVTFALGNYDRSREVVIDPTVTYSTYLGGSLDDEANAIAVDSSGNAYITGETDSTNLTGAGAPVGTFDVFVTKLNAAGVLQFTTLVGGSLADVGNAIAVDSTGIYVAGTTSSLNFPVQSGPQQAFLAGTNHGFLFKLNSAGTALAYSTLIEGSTGESALGLAVDSNHEAYVVGDTVSADLGSNTPGTNGTVNPLPGGGTINNNTTTGSDDAFIAKLKSDGTQYLFLSYLGGSNIDSAEAVALDGSGNVYVTGLTLSTDFPVTSGAFQTKCGTDASGSCNASGGNVFDDAFVTAINSSNNPGGYIYSTYLGGENKDDAFAIAVDAAGNASVTGQTFSTQYPTKNPLTNETTLSGTQDVFVASLNPAGTALNYSTYLGGSGSEAGDGIAVDGNGNTYVTGYTTSSNFPVTSSTSTFSNGSTFLTDAFVTELNLNGTSLSLPFSAYLGGTGDEDFVFGALAVDASGNIYVTGVTNSVDFPVLNAADGTYNSSGGNCTLASGGSPVHCPDAFVTVYAPNADFSLAGTALAGVSPGGSSTSTITVTPFNGYSGTVTLSCLVSGTATTFAPACKLSSSTVTGGAGTSTLTVTTTAPTARLAPPGSGRRLIFYASLLPLFGFVTLGLASASSSTRRRVSGLLCLTVVLTGLIVLPACGGSSSGGGGGGGGGQPGTPAGTYTITVTGTDGTITHSIAPPLTLTVN